MEEFVLYCFDGCRGFFFSKRGIIVLFWNEFRFLKEREIIDLFI